MDHGADPNRTTRAGMTPLLFAMGPGRRKSAKDTLEAVTVCLDGGADVNATNDMARRRCTRRWVRAMRW